MDLEKAFNTFKISDYLHMFKNNHSILIYEEITIEEPFIIIKCESHYCKKIL